MSEIPQFDQGVVTEDKDESGNYGSSGPSIPEIEEDVAQFIIDGITQSGGVIEIPAFDSEADEMPDKYTEYYEGIEADTLSVESLFGNDWGKYDYIGTPPVTQSEELSDSEKEKLTDDQLLKSDGDEKKYVVKPEFASEFDGAEVLKGGTTPISKSLNGRFSHLVVDNFGDDSKISVGKGKKRNHDGDEVEAQKYVAFWVSDSDTAEKQRRKAQYEAGEITEETFAEWKQANGYELSDSEEEAIAESEEDSEEEEAEE